MEHFRAYTAALKKQDFVTAESEAHAAYEASLQAYGDGGRTAVLALNLAEVRLMKGDRVGAEAPAEKALALAEANGASGVDPRLARLMLDRTQLRSAGAKSIGRLERSLQEVAAVPEFAPMAYLAAVELAIFATEQKQFGPARNAWSVATRILQAERSPNALLLARSRIGEATAGVLALATSSKSSHGSDYQPFDAQLADIASSLAPEARKAGPTAALTSPQSLYAQAVAWRTVIRAKITSDGLKEFNAPEVEGVEEIGAERHPLPRCAARYRSEAKPRFPPAERMEGGLGAVVYKFRVDESGLIVESTVAASIGGPAFVDSIEAVLPTARYVKLDESETGCQMAREVFMRFTYLYR